MGNVLNGVKAQLERFSPRQLVVAGLAIALILGASTYLVRWFTTPDYDVLFSGLAPADAAEVVAAVEATGTEHKIVEAGTTTTVLVPTEDVGRLRMNLAAEDLPGDSVVGYELLDSQGVTVSTFREQVNYQRALEGELARTLATLDAVESASVHIVLPRERLYTSQEAPATAAVTLRTSGPLGREEVNAITNLVASSVPDLDPDAVTVTDAAGQLLTDTDGASGGSGSSSEAEAAYAARLEARASSMLAAVVGEGRAVVRVEADLDFTARTRQTELFDPEQVATNKEKVENEEYSSRTPGNGGVLTTDPDEGDDENATTNDYTRESADRDFSISREVTSETDAPGEVNRLTVSVLLDDQASPADAAQVEDLVAGAVGFDEGRGDDIVVEFLPFVADPEAETGTDPAAAAAAAAERAKLMVGLAAAAALGLGVLMGGFLMLRNRKTTRGNDDKDTHSGDAGGSGSPLPVGGMVDPTAPLGVPSSASGEADRLIEKVQERPGAAADVIRGLMASDEVRR